jgi:hypothetical protein
LGTKVQRASSSRAGSPPFPATGVFRNEPGLLKLLSPITHCPTLRRWLLLAAGTARWENARSSASCLSRGRRRSLADWPSVTLEIDCFPVAPGRRIATGTAIWILSPKGASRLPNNNSSDGGRAGIVGADDPTEAGGTPFSSLIQDPCSSFHHRQAWDGGHLRSRKECQGPAQTNPNLLGRRQQSICPSLPIHLCPPHRPASARITWPRLYI